MTITIDTKENEIISVVGNEENIVTPMYSQKGFKILSDIWLKQGWNQLHWKSFSWFGFEIWQLPEDLLRLQEVIMAIKPDVIIETGISRGGSAIFFASMCRLLNKGRVISIDITIPDDVRHAIEESPFSDLISLIEGDSASLDVINDVKAKVSKEEKTFIFLDSDHTKSHVLRELHAYSTMVTPKSYIVATDGVMQSLVDTPYGDERWVEDNPAAAAREFVAGNSEFVIKRPTALFGDEHVIESMTYWPDAWLYRLPLTKEN